MTGPSLWRSLVVIAAAMAVGLVAGPWLLLAAQAVGPTIATLMGTVIGWRRDLLLPIGVGMVLGVFAVILGFALGFLLQAGRFVAGWALGFCLSEELWRPALANLIEGGHPHAIDKVLLAIVTALALSLLAALGLDGGHRTRAGRKA